jgi:hypothetical protein
MSRFLNELEFRDGLNIPLDETGPNYVETSSIATLKTASPGFIPT